MEMKANEDRDAPEVVLLECQTHTLKTNGLLYVYWQAQALAQSKKANAFFSS